jgi:TIGR03009 family protein
MFRHFSSRRLIGLLILTVLGTFVSPLNAQVDNAPGSDLPRRSRIDRAGLSVPDMRVDATTGDPVDPKVDAILDEWYNRTKRIKKIEGKHRRATLDFVFGTETRSEGHFYVETPDKGRIDIQKYNGTSPKVGSKVPRRAPNGKDVKLEVRSTEEIQRWICNGKEIKVIDDTRRTYDVVKIPPEQQGVNIMDGPLPFLFGMPPEKAKARYRFRLIQKEDPRQKKEDQRQDERYFWIRVTPKLKQDAIEWRVADLVMSRETYLPERVSLFDPSGKKETIYLFTDIQVNKSSLLPPIFSGDPFNPTLFRYVQTVHNPGNARGGDLLNKQSARPITVYDESKKTAEQVKNETVDDGNASPALPTMPFMVGAPYDEVRRFKAQEERLGRKVEFRRGTPATTEDQIYRVESQNPRPKTPLQPGQRIILTLHTRGVQQNAAKPPSE